MKKNIVKENLVRNSLIVGYLVGLSFLGWSCSSSKSMMVEVRKPAAISLSPNINNLLILNQSDNVNKDASTHYVDALTQFLSAENHFDNIEMYNLKVEGIEPSYVAQASPEIIAQFAEQKGADAVLTVDELIVDDKKIPYSQTFNWAPYPLNLAKLVAHLSLYNQEGERITPRFYVESDSIFYYTGEISPFQYQDVSQEYAIELADNTTKLILPYWQTQERFLYKTKGKNSKEAQEMAEANNWADAAILWGADFETQNNAESRSKIAANIALANEMVGDFQNALEWADIALELPVSAHNRQYLSEMNWYRGKLKSRIDETNKVIRQQRQH